MKEKYESPKVEFVEIEENDIMTASSECPKYEYGDTVSDD